MIVTVNPDFISLISDLRSKGKTLQEIGDRVGVGKSTISEIGSGKNINPSYKTGAGIIQLHDYFCKD